MKTIKTIQRLAVLAGLLSIAGTALAQDSYWTNTASGNFGDSGNWSGGVPGPSTNVWFDNGQTFTVTMDGNYSTRGVIVTNGTAVTIDLNDGTPRTWEAAGPTDTRNPKFEVDGSSLTFTDNGILDANNTPNYQFWTGMVLKNGATALIQNGAYVEFGYVSSINVGAIDKLIVTDPGTILKADYGVSSVAGASILVTNGATLNAGTSYTTGGDFTITGAGSKGQFGGYLYGPSSVKITDGGRVDSTSQIFSPNVMIGGGSGVSTGQVQFSYIGDGYGSWNWKVTTNGVLEVIGDFLDVRDGYYPATSSILTLDQGTISMQTNSLLRLKENAVYANNDGYGGILRGNGTIKRGPTPGANFQILSDGEIRPGDTTATPAIGTLSVENGDLVQNGGTGTKTLFDFDPTTPGLADLIDITGGTATIAGSLVFSNLVAGPLVYGTWDFLIADDITYTGTDNMAALISSLGVAGPADVSFGVVNVGGQDILRLMVAIPEPSTVGLIGFAGLVFWRKSRARKQTVS